MLVHKGFQISCWKNTSKHLPFFHFDSFQIPRNLSVTGSEQYKSVGWRQEILAL